MLVQHSVWHVVSSIPMLYRRYTDTTSIQFRGRLGSGKVWQLSSLGHHPNGLLCVFMVRLYVYKWLKLQSDIGDFPSVCGTCPNNNRQTVRMTNVHIQKRTCNRNTTHNLGARLAHGYTASKWPSRYPIMKRSRSYCQTVTWLYCKTVSQSSHVTAWHSRSYCPTHFWYSCFTFLCLSGYSLTGALRVLFIIGYNVVWEIHLVW